MLENYLKLFLVWLFGLVGIRATFSKKGISSSFIEFDKASLLAYFEGNEKTKLYQEAMRASKMDDRDNFPKQCRFYNLHQILELVQQEKIKGDVAECGCWKGHSSYIISRILSVHQFEGTFHIFDSFEGGLSELSSEDENKRIKMNDASIKIRKEKFGSTEEELKETLKTFNNIEVHKGWIPDRFPDIESKQFSFVHIDVDLYQPTLDSLTFFYPRLSSGGAIVIDDYGYTSFPGAKKAVDEFLATNVCDMFYEVPTGGCFIIK